ncbi:MAG: hypothetical protein ABI813_09255 [Bacteroidota bacterium]
MNKYKISALVLGTFYLWLPATVCRQKQVPVAVIFDTEIICLADGSNDWDKNVQRD